MSQSQHKPLRVAVPEHKPAFNEWIKYIYEQCKIYREQKKQHNAQCECANVMIYESKKH